MKTERHWFELCFRVASASFERGGERFPATRPGCGARRNAALRGASVSRNLASSILVFEIVTNVRDELWVGRVIQCLDAGNDGLERVVVTLQVANEVELGRRRANNQKRAGAFERGCDFVIIAAQIRVCALVRGLARHVVVGSGDFTHLEAVRLDLENLGFSVVNPNSNVMGHAPL
jgi:hypothetical protein